jgi:hypothetical protein
MRGLLPNTGDGSLTIRVKHHWSRTRVFDGISRAEIGQKPHPVPRQKARSTANQLVVRVTRKLNTTGAQQHHFLTRRKIVADLWRK